MRQTGDRFQAEDLGPLVAVVCFKDGTEDMYGVNTEADAKALVRNAMLGDSNVTGGYSASRSAPYTIEVD